MCLLQVKKVTMVMVMVILMRKPQRRLLLHL